MVLRFLICLSFIPLAGAETPVQHQLELKLHHHLKELDDRTHGVLGIATIDLTSGRVYVYNGDVVFPTASTIKIPILATMFRANVKLDEQLTIEPKDTVGGSGRLQNELKNGPVNLNVRQLMTAMIQYSDNTATNRCIRIAGMENVNKMLASFGFRATRLRRIMLDTAAATRGDENTTTPLEMARIVELLYRNKLTPAPQTADMLSMLKLVNADIRKVIPANIEVASKPGDLTGVHCETAIVYLPGRPFILSVYSSFLDENTNPVPEVAHLVFEYFRKLAESNQYGNKIK